MDTRNDPRVYLEGEVRKRAVHRSPGDVRDTYSFANADRIFGQEYHGRFLIELLQNAADASRVSGRSRVAIRVALDGRALLVANRGTPIEVVKVVDSLGQIGQSTKEEGESIGHKGIGFKSVLELTLTPEIYSGLQNPSQTLAVRFDPKEAEKIIREASHEAGGNWDELVAKVEGLDKDDPFAAIPILRFPYWIDKLPPDVVELKERGFDTVVRLPFDERFAKRLKLNANEWLHAVEHSLRGVSDRILLLLGCFDEVCIENLHDGSKEIITREWDEDPDEIDDGVSREIVRVRRNGELSSRWRLFRRELPNRPKLEEIAVGIRISDDTNGTEILPAIDKEPSIPFHLFFPTEIQSGLPFLLHAYFKVNAARAGFYDGSRPHNKTMLNELAALVKVAVEDAVKDESLDLASLVNLVAEAKEPEDKDAREFRLKVLCLLDKVAWIPLKDGHEERRSECPERVFAERPDIVRRIGDTFPESYIERRSGIRLPDAKLGERALELVKSRRPEEPGLWEFVGCLCRPGGEPPWDDDSADKKFLRLIELFKALDGMSPPETKELLDGLRGDPDSRLIPTVGDRGTRKFLPVPDPTPGKRGRLVMARVRSSSGHDLVPPDDLGVAFLHEGLFSSVEEVNEARRLRVQPFIVDTVLDRLGGIETSQGNETALVRFLWQFLARERRSGFGTKQSADRAATFDPSEWFWCAPGSVWHDDVTRERQQRERHLTAVPLPCQDGKWRKAGQIAFGADWADWLEKQTDEHRTEAAKRRIAAYRAMEKLSPGREHLLASPNEVLSLLDDEVFKGLVDEDEESGEKFGSRRRNAEKHAFLLRLGVWEVPPIEAFQNRVRSDNRFPPDWQIANKQRETIESNDGWRFDLGGFRGDRHYHVHLAEDYRFLWPLEGMARRSESALVECLQFGAKLYDERSHALVFCPNCGSHTRWRKSTSADGYTSSLAIQLRSERWLSCTLDGEPLETLLKPESAWWLSKPPSGAALRQSPWRLVPLCGVEGVDENLRSLVGLNNLDGASADVVERLLLDLRERFPEGPSTSGGIRQAFVGLHRLAYERLSELAASGTPIADVMARTGVLCELGDSLKYCRPDEARHDDGRFTAYIRHFVGHIPFAILPKDRAPVARQLGIAPFRLELKRLGEDAGRDVTDEARAFHGDRIAELLAIMVHHSLGAQTPEVTSDEFEARVRRIRNLKIMQLDDLVVDATAEGSGFQARIGEGSDRDLFLENPASTAPILFHDFSGDDWRDRLRQKISPYLATVLGNAAYHHTFALFLLAERDDEREEFLHELGISSKEVADIEARIGVERKEDRESRARWFRALLATLGYESPDLDLDPENLASKLKDSGLPENVAHSLANLGGREEARRETGEGSALRILANAGVKLNILHENLKQAGDDGLSVGVSRRIFSRWMNANGPMLSAVLATMVSPDEAAKARVRQLEPPPEYEFSLDPALSDLLSPVVEALREAGMEGADALANDPAPDFVKLGGFGTAEELNEKVSRLFDKEERERFLRERAAEWRKEIRLLAVLVESGPHDTTANIRSLDERVDKELADNPSEPPVLHDDVQRLFGADLAQLIKGNLLATVNAPAPDRNQLVEWAGVSAERLERVRRALERPRRERVRRLKGDMDHLRERKVLPAVPGEFQPPRQPTKRPEPEPGPRPVPPIKIDEKHDQRKRELGSEGERWALAAVIRALTELDEEDRDNAINEIEALLKEQFEGEVVEKALGHAATARSRDEEERIEALSGLLHVSQYSDAFGFDMIGWLPTGPGGESQAVCLEVKSSTGEGFHFSLGEWSFAEKLHSEGKGTRYAVLVVRRGRSGGVPNHMDLLSDPVALVNDGRLHRTADGYQIAYRAKKS